MGGCLLGAAVASVQPQAAPYLSVPALACMLWVAVCEVTPAGPAAGCAHLSPNLLVVLIAFYMHLAWLEVVCWAKAVSFNGDVPVPLVLLLSLSLALLFGTCSVSSSD